MHCLGSNAAESIVSPCSALAEHMEDIYLTSFQEIVDRMNGQGSVPDQLEAAANELQSDGNRMASVQDTPQAAL